MYKKLLVAFDGSEHSYKALDHAVAIAEKLGSELVLLTVIPTMITPFLTDARAKQERCQRTCDT